MTLRLLDGIREIAADYDGFILDVWGVLHDGAAPYPDVVETLRQLRAIGKQTAVLSNAPRRAHLVAQRMSEIGIPRDSYDYVHSSGEEAWQHLMTRDDPFYRALGRDCYHMGPERDESMFEGLPLTRVAAVEDASFVLNTGPWGWEETVGDYEDALQRARRRDLPMICANPDLVVMHQHHLVICAGALAKRYEEVGGRVRWHGKPFPSVYATCFALMGLADRGRILAIGDSLRTDIAGADGVGIASVLVAGGIHREEFGLGESAIPDMARIEAAARAAEHRPSAVIAKFCW